MRFPARQCLINIAHYSKLCTQGNGPRSGGTEAIILGCPGLVGDPILPRNPSDIRSNFLTFEASAQGQFQKSGCPTARSALPPETDIVGLVAEVRLVPCVDGSGLARAFFTVLQRWSVQPCVRPFDAVHMTAGHNALRGSGPDQQPAFDNAWGQLGCPDRRIDRLCITCCCSAPQLFSTAIRHLYVVDHLEEKMGSSNDDWRGQ